MTEGQLNALAGRDLTDAELDRIGAAIKRSTLSDAVSNIVDEVTGWPGTGRQSDDRPA